jgi:hypothetical protein
MNSKRFVPLAEYQRLSGLSYSTVRFLCDSGQLRTIRTEGGLLRIDTKSNESADTTTIVKRLDDQARLLEALCAHLGVS